MNHDRDHPDDDMLAREPLDRASSGKEEPAYTGKAKQVFDDPDPKSKTVRIKFLDTIGSLDRPDRDPAPWKARTSNTVTCNVFRFLERSGVRTAFVERIDEKSFRALRCDMLPYEIVVTGMVFARSSWLKRNPAYSPDQVLDPTVDIFLKTTGRRWRGKEQVYDLPKDDPLITFDEHGMALLWLPGKPLKEQTPFLTLPVDEVFHLPNEAELIEEATRSALRIYHNLGDVFDRCGASLYDIKLEFGMSPFRDLVAGDDFAPDCWRVYELKRGMHLDKQPHRDGAPLSVVQAGYERAAELSARFLE